jgi:hypothetical protein
LIFAQNQDPSSIHLREEQLITISKRLCCFMMHEFILPKGRYHPDNCHMADNASLWHWVGESQDKLRIVHKHFEHYLSVWTSVMVIYGVWTFVIVILLYICVMFNKMCAWIWFGLNFWWNMCMHTIMSGSDGWADVNSPVAIVRLVATGG